MNSFKHVFELWYAHYSSTVLSITAKKKHREFHLYILPEIGHLNIDEIKPRQILDLSNKIALHSTYYATRLTADVIRIFDYAVIILQLMDFNHVARVTRYLVKHNVVGFRFVDFAHLPYMLKDIDNIKGSAKQFKIALQVLIYTALRRSEVACAKKSEFDFNKNIWTIPPERMKIKATGSHIVPLSSSVLSLLEQVYNNKTDYMFPKINQNRHIDPWSLYHMIKKAGWLEQQTVHGFRKIFSTHAHMSRLWTIDAIELSLAHKITGVRGVYNHANMLDERIELMRWYANEVDSWRGINYKLNLQLK